jgi:hypothetical protein
MTKPNMPPAGSDNPETSDAVTMKNAWLARTTDVRRRKSIERVWEALEYMRARGETDWTLANVERTLTGPLKYSGPKAQSMSNDPNKEFVALVELYAREHGRQRATPDGDDAFIEVALVKGIPDVRLRQDVLATYRTKRSLLESVRRLEAKYAALCGQPTLEDPRAAGAGSAARAPAER